MLYSIKKSFATHQIKKGQHTIYFEEYGNIKGIPVLFLHGGPGSGCNEGQKAIFNAKKFRVIFLDQRGSGRSTPKRCTENNTTYLLVQDIEMIRKFLEIKKWYIVGGSWGSTLAIAYAQEHNEQVLGMVLRSLFLGTKKEVEWAFKTAPLYFRPELIFEINRILNQKKTINPIYTLGKMLDSSSLEIQNQGARFWLAYESNLSKIKFNYEIFNKARKNFIFEKSIIPNTPFLEWHYIKNDFFLKNNQLFKCKKKLLKIPMSIVQSDYDLLCPPFTSFEFSKDLPKCKIERVEVAGHYFSDPGVKEKMKLLLDDICE